MYVYLLDKSLRIEIYYDESEQQYEDNICLSIVEDCPDEEKLFRHDETNIYLTVDEACQLAKLLRNAIIQHRQDTCDDEQDS